MNNITMSIIDSTEEFNGTLQSSLILKKELLPRMAKWRHSAPCTMANNAYFDLLLRNLEYLQI